MSFVKVLGDMDGMISMDIHFKGALVFSGVFDLVFLLFVDIWNDVQKGSISMSCQTFPVSPVISDLVDLCPNL